MRFKSNLEFFPLFALPDLRAFSFFSFTCDVIISNPSSLVNNLTLSYLNCLFIIIAVDRTVICGAARTRIEVHVATLGKNLVLVHLKYKYTNTPPGPV